MNGEPSHLYKGHHKNLGSPITHRITARIRITQGLNYNDFAHSEYTVPYFMSYTYMYEQNSTILQLEGQGSLYCFMYIS